MSASKLQDSDIRIEHSLNHHEEQFVQRRLKTVQQTLETFEIHCPLDKVPKIALLGSGGGQRAMVGLLGSLVELKNTGLLDLILYLSGVSGSTWCMASLYQHSDWSVNMDSVKQKIVERLKGPPVSWDDSFSKLKKYYYEKDYFSLTDFWAVMLVTTFVKEIDERKVSEQQIGHDRDPFPIYAVIDKQSRQENDGDPWCEISPYEAGYSLTGAFVDVSKFGCQFQDGREIKTQPEMDMLYLQADCGSCIADGPVNAQYVLEKIKEFIHNIIQRKEVIEAENNMTLPPEDDLHHLVDPGEGFTEEPTLESDDELTSGVSVWPLNVLRSLSRCMFKWIWGRKYNFMYKIKDDKVLNGLPKTQTRDYEDAGISNNSPYMSVLREARDVDLIISLDYSDGDPFTTVKKAADRCVKLNIPFPKVKTPPGHEKYPKDFYVFEGDGEAPTVIHIPLFNTQNCGDQIDEWRRRYLILQTAYSPELIDDLLEVSGKNISNNKERLLDEIRKCIGAKSAKR